ncbi:hypothetical protein [Paenibacillus sp. WLX2291]|uniref:hypothetical protein n=1 Tax=Paenibacillus sp. WLX2291 TaxID=3296934 RepID=UPI0039840C49
MIRLMHQSLIKKSTCLFMVMILFATVIGESLGQVHAEANYQFEGTEYADIEKFMYAIDAIPEEVLEQGSEATAQWISQYTGQEYIASSDFQIQAINPVSCGSAIATLILSNAIPIAKLAKFKELIKAGGGVKTFASTMITAYQIARGDGYTKAKAIEYGIKYAAKEAGPELIQTGLSIFGVGALYGTCFE